MKKVLSALILLACFSTTLAFEYNRVPAGQIKGVRQSWVSNTTIKIGVGYGEIMGSYWEIAPTDVLVTTGYTLTGLTTTSNGIFHYLYIDRARSSLPYVALRNSTTAPVWSDEFMGWYNGLDRCIGVVWVNADGAVNYFRCSDDESYEWETTTLLIPGGISTSFVWNTFDFGTLVPVNAKEIQVGLHIWESTVSWSACRAGVTSERGKTSYGEGIMQTESYYSIPYERGALKKCRWFAQATSTTGNIHLYIRSYRIER